MTMVYLEFEGSEDFAFLAERIAEQSRYGAGWSGGAWAVDPTALAELIEFCERDPEAYYELAEFGRDDQGRVIVKNDAWPLLRETCEADAPVYVGRIVDPDGRAGPEKPYTMREIAGIVQGLSPDALHAILDRAAGRFTQFDESDGATFPGDLSGSALAVRATR